MDIKKAIIPVAGLGTRFLPLSKVVPKIFWPLVDKPVVQYLVEEAKASGIKEVIFVVRPARNVSPARDATHSDAGGAEKKMMGDYFGPSLEIEQTLRHRKKDKLLAELRKLEELCRGLSFSFVAQEKPLGDGHAILQAEKLIGQELCCVLFADDVVESEVPCILQLMQVFKTCQNPVIALYKLPKEKLPSYGIVKVEKIANRFFKIKNIVEKPKIEEAPSDLAIVGKYILTPAVFEELKALEPSKERGEIILADALAKMLKSGKILYGYEFRGKWLECGNKQAWLNSHFYLSLKHPKFGPELKKIYEKDN